MNFIRSAFISLFVLLIMLLSLYAGVQLWRNMTPWMSWLGLLLAATAPLMYLVLERFRANQADGLQPIGFSSVCGLGVAIAMASSWKHGNVAGVVHLWAGACLIAWLVYLKLYRKTSLKNND
jgi:hypothetical protein